LHKDIGVDQIGKHVVKTLNKPKIATHYGCHILRPRQIVQFDDPEEPSIFDQLVEIIGAESVDWKSKVKCCGAPVWGINDDLSMDLIENKVTDARQSEAEYLCVSCAYCQLQFDRVQRMLNEKRNKTDFLPSILYTQLLGLCLGIDAETLGIDQNELNIRAIMNYLS
jgi:heterodisulfide reductase subunit B